MILVGGVGVGAFFGIKRLVAPFQRIDFQPGMLAAIGAVALLLAARIIAGGIRSAGAQRLHESKAEAYGKFIGLWEELLGAGHSGDARLARQMQNVNRLLLLHGKASVVKAHAAMQGMDQTDARAQFGDALLEIRKDLGLDSFGLPPEELVQLLLGDGDDGRGLGDTDTHRERGPRVSLRSS
jgi:hypothetical protein